MVAVQNNFSLYIKYKEEISINKIKIVGRWVEIEALWEHYASFLMDVFSYKKKTHVMLATLEHASRW